MIPLNLPTYSFRLKKNTENQIFIFDSIRKKWIMNTPEEWVRQHWIHYFINELKVPTTNISIESGLKLGERQKRTDVLIFKNFKPILLLECKAPEIKINDLVYTQAIQYNRVHQVKYLLLSNGIKHLLYEINYLTGQLNSIENLDTYHNW